MEAVTLIGIDGNAFCILGYVRKHMKRAGMTRQDVEAYTAEAMAGEYEQLITVSQEMVDTINSRLEEQEA